MAFDYIKYGKIQMVEINYQGKLVFVLLVPLYFIGGGGSRRKCGIIRYNSIMGQHFSAQSSILRSKYFKLLQD